VAGVAVFDMEDWVSWATVFMVEQKYEKNLSADELCSHLFSVQMLGIFKGNCLSAGKFCYCDA
jgi:hypothetical protein